MVGDTQADRVGDLRLWRSRRFTVASTAANWRASGLATGEVRARQAAGVVRTVLGWCAHVGVAHVVSCLQQPTIFRTRSHLAGMCAMISARMVPILAEVG
jgi:hypothetical protein